ncbi:uncharacterized protein LOC121419757 [Lytechinus variegatus]|uniref:uncharacterized protein LOC121419757 n=1 Tax=Lytechinus variegatus TaxID=7654 RepID=UPI001BB222F7|nr:uncharacterized protein LOC121419757 [Lytechinus variegatus]
MASHRRGHESDSDSDFSDREADAGDIRKKKRKLKGAATYRCKFSPDWTKTFGSFITKGDNNYSFRCTLCNRTVSCGHMGLGDVQRHIKLDMHTQKVAAMRRQPTLNFPRVDPLAEKATRAEVKVATMLVQNNIPLALADELTPLLADIFPDSQIANKYAARRTKTACIINGAVAPFFQRKLVDHMKNHPFSIAIDGSSDNDIEKMNPMTVRIFDMGRVNTQFLDMCMSSQSTAEALFNKMDEVLRRHNIQWENCVGLGVDNTSVNMGCRNSIKTRVLQKNETTYVMGCGCHIVHNTAGKASDAFEQVSGFNVEEMAIDIFYWFDKSTKRKAALLDYCIFCDQEYRRVLKHVNTRWLSLETAVSRILKQYAGLKSYFLSEDDRAPRFRRLHLLFAEPMTEVYLLFYQSALQTFMHMKLFLQREYPVIPLVYAQMQSFLQKLASRFVRVQTIREANRDFINLTFRDLNVQLSDDNLMIGFATKNLVKKLLDEGSISPHQQSRFFQSVRAFYCRAFSYAVEHLPLDDRLLKNAAFVNFMRRENATLSEVEFFVDRFSTLLPYQSPQEMDRLAEEFTTYQLMEEDTIPRDVWTRAKVSEEGHYRMDVIWQHLSNMKAPDNSPLLPRLAKVAELVLFLPHSNAQEERVFSMVRKNKTAFRPNLDPKGTLSSILTIKLAYGAPAHTFEPDKNLLKVAKSSTWEYNKEHSSKD